MDGKRWQAARAEIEKGEKTCAHPLESGVMYAFVGGNLSPTRHALTTSDAMYETYRSSIILLVIPPTSRSDISVGLPPLTIIRRTIQHHMSWSWTTVVINLVTVTTVLLPACGGCSL
jgi:hypothetical protein